MNVISIALDRLHAHPANSNVMPPPLLEKLAAHLQRSDRYPPIIVRPFPAGGEGAYQILDGHHRVAALKRIERTEARCVVWEVDDDEALLLLGTLNRLQGQDDPRKRAALVAQLQGLPGAALEQLAQQLPEDREGLEALLKLHAPPPPPRQPIALDDMPVAVHFFLLPAQKRELEARLTALGGTRETALMRLVHLAEPQC